MTNTEKRILLKELCAILPYGVKVNEDIQGDFTLIGLTKERVLTTCEVEGCHNDFPIELIKPYLFPLHSAPKDFIKKYNEFFENYSDDFNEEDEINFSTELIDLFHEYHIDYRGLIDMGLALDATNKNVYKL